MPLLTQTGRAELPILVVDDDPSIRGMLQTGLQTFGFEVVTAAGVEEARRMLQSRPFQMVLCDYDMPDGNGMDVLSYVDQVLTELPVIMLTGHTEVPLASRAIRNGATDYLCKPVSIRQLIRVIEQNRARVERDRERAARLTEEVLTGTIRALVAAVDAKDPHTASHSSRVTRLALKLGGALGLSPERLRVLEFSALLHDVGKIGVPSAILRKPGPLTEEEWIVIKRHPVASAEIVNQVDALGEVATIVRHHHERVDGGGYPDGLVGAAIHPFSRMIAIADVYEALTADRAYRPARSPEEARRLIREGIGTQFDPAMARCFLEMPEL
ncbi:MAG: HD domain-containing phosphohydrolase [Armatimonadota bacterium]